MTDSTDSNDSTSRIWIQALPESIGRSVVLRGWVAARRSSGKIAFLQLRDGSGVVQCVAGRSDVDDPALFDILPPFVNAGEEVVLRVIELSVLGFSGE